MYYLDIHDVKLLGATEPRQTKRTLFFSKIYTFSYMIRIFDSCSSFNHFAHTVKPVLSGHPRGKL